MAYEIGTLVTMDEVTGNSYRYTRKDNICVVTELHPLKIALVGWRNSREPVERTAPDGYPIEGCFLRPTTVNDIFTVRRWYNGWTPEKAMEAIDKASTHNAGTVMMDWSRAGDEPIPEEEKAYFREEIKALLQYLRIYNPTDYGVGEIVDTWAKNNVHFWNTFKNSPYWIGHGRIRIPGSVFNRPVDPEKVADFWNLCANKATQFIPVEYKGDTIYSYKELNEMSENLGYILDSCRNCMNVVNMEKYRALQEDYERLTTYINTLKKRAREDENLIKRGSHIYTVESYNQLEAITRAFKELSNWLEPTANEELTELINKAFPELEPAHVGMKITKIWQKIVKKYPEFTDMGTRLVTYTDQNGVDHETLKNIYTEALTKYGDGINPATFERDVFISLNPIDYLTESWGKTYRSCYDIDKEGNRDNLPEHADGYSGCFCAGTLNDMLDKATLIVYTLSREDLEINDWRDGRCRKIDRVKIFVGEDKFILCRIYPKDCDDSAQGKQLYQDYRALLQKFFAETFKMDNLWVVQHGREAVRDMIDTSEHGPGYRDFNQSYARVMSVSYIKHADGTKNTERIKVGHAAICPSCGKRHDYDESLECQSCWGNEEQCSGCGDYHDPDDMWEIAGEWYCVDCTFYCDGHQEREVYDPAAYHGDTPWGEVCDDFYYENTHECEHCGDSFYPDEGIETYDGNYYCCRHCAEADGYHLDEDGDWVPAEDDEENA